MPRAIDNDLLQCLRRANPYTEYRVEISEPDVGQVLRRSDQFTTPVSMSPANSLSASPRGPLTLTPTSAALANFTGVTSDYDLNGEAESRRLKGLAWKLDGAFNRASLKSVQARVKRIPLAGQFFPADFELQVFKITKTPGVMQSNVGTPQYQSTAWVEYSFSPLLNPAPVIKYGSITWDGSQNATLNFDVSNWGLILDNSLVRAVSPDQTGELPEYLIVVRLTGKMPSGTGHFKLYLDTASSRTIAGVGAFERVWWARDNDQQQWARNAFADVPSVTVNVEAYPATGSAIYLIDLGAVPKAVFEGRIVFERAVPPGTTATLELSTAGSGGAWTAVKHGDPVTVKQQTYHLRVTETTDAALKATPAVNALGIEFRTPRDVSLEAIPQLPTREVEMPWGAASIPEGKIRVVKTGKKDYLDVATSIGSSSPASRLEADIYLASRHPSVTRDKWHRLERMMVTNRMPSATSEEFTLLSYASRLKRKIPAKIESLNSVHTVQAGSTTSQLIVLPVLPGTTASGNEYDGKNYYMRVRTTAAPNTPAGMVQVIQGNTSTDRLDFSPALSEALVTGDVIEVHSGIYNTQVVSWSDYDPADVWWEVLTTHLAIAPERIGAGYLPRGGKPPKVTDRAPGDATTQAKLKVTGRISEQESGDEILDQISAIMGGVTMEVDGQIVFIQLLPLRDAAGEVTVPLPPSVATLDARDISSLSTPPGLEKRSTVLSANYGVPATAADPDQFPSRSTTATDGDALLWLAQQDLEDFGAAEVPKEITRWFYNSADAGLYLASVFNAQIVKATSTGLRVFPTTLAERYPEFLPGDVLVIQTSQYTDYDPSTQTQLKGPLAIRGVIVKLGGEGRQLALFIPGLGENVTQVAGGAQGALTGLGPTPAAPILSASFDATGQLIINSSGDFATAAQKLAWANVSAPTEAETRTASPIFQQNVSGLATGTIYAPGVTVYVAAFAYSANGLESTPLSVISVSREGDAIASKPYVNLTTIESIYTTETFRIDGVATAYPIVDWRKRIDDEMTGEGAWGAWQTSTLPQNADVPRGNRWGKFIVVEARDSAGNVSIPVSAYVLSRMSALDDSAGTLDETRATNSGYNVFNRGRDTAIDVIPTVARTFVESTYVDGSLRPINVYRGGASESVGNLFKRGSDTAADVVSTAARTFIEPGMVDGSLRVINVYRAAATEPVGNLFKRGTDQASDVVVTSTRTFVDPQAATQVDASGRIVGVYRLGVYEPVNNLLKVGDVPALTGAGASGTWNIAITSSARYMQSADTRAVNDWPQDFSVGLWADFKENGAVGLWDGGSFTGVLTFRKYGSSSDFTGGPLAQLAYTDNAHLWLRLSATASTWAPWKRMAFLSETQTWTAGQHFPWITLDNGGGQFEIGTDASAGGWYVYSGAGGYRLKVSHSGATFAGWVVLAATQRLYLDGGSDTYIQEGAANRLDFITGGSWLFYMSASLNVSRVPLAVDTGIKLYLDGGGDTYIYESAANQVDIVTGGGLRLRANTVGAYASDFILT